ncbi:ABC transporter permease [Peredibacter starrii]|uniref:ABC transporter permease n=1 Tax=Peredibacter starrii TaxID=28202 RepID=A0AAX4HNG6_9BACT|nr:ABC transporter permease [Peredibacter starrii]WPU64683.1 ABC transporter permease [Peredibacter starrii]
MNSYLSILKIVLHGRSAGKILLATVFSFTFSIAVILCTFGLMDGFDHLLKSGLRHSSGDIILTNRRGFFPVTAELKEKIDSVKPIAVTPVIQTEAFALHGDSSKGVLVRGIEEDSFSKTTGLKVKVPSGSVVIGEELAKQFKVKVGDEIALTFGRGNEAASSLPTIKLFQISSLVKHGIYQKDLRFVYLNRADLAELLGLGNKVNQVILSVKDVNKPLENLDDIEASRQKLRLEVSSDYLVRPFWNEYSFLIEAVKVEKFSISLILQLIVVVAVFNIIAFVIYIMEKKAQDFFFLRAVGMSLSSLTRFWFISVIIIWAVSCVGAYIASHIFNWGLQNLWFLQIPGEIYVLSSLNIRLDLMAYVTVYAVSLLWILIAAFGGYLRMRNKPIIQGLRQEFSS